MYVQSTCLLLTAGISTASLGKITKKLRRSCYCNLLLVKPESTYQIVLTLATAVASVPQRFGDLAKHRVIPVARKPDDTHKCMAQLPAYMTQRLGFKM